MTEFTHGIFSASKAIYENNKGSILRTIIYTIGHFAIAITVLMLIADVAFIVALTDAIVEPLANAVWYFILDKVWTIAKHMGYSRYFKVIPDGQIIDDHYYVNQAGIPCIDIIHRDPQNGSFANSWHTHNDNMNNISAKTLKSVTDVVMQTIYREDWYFRMFLISL